MISSHFQSKSWNCLSILLVLAIFSTPIASGNKTVKLFEQVKCRVYKDYITVSGISTGSTMAQAFHLSHSKLFSGIGSFAGHFYHCGGYSPSGELQEHYAKCGEPGGYETKNYQPNATLSNVKFGMDKMIEYEANKLIDPLSGLETQKVWIWVSTKDQWVPIRIQASVVDIYEPYLKCPLQIRSVIQRSTHLLPTKSKGTKCTELTIYKDGLIGNCNYNGVFKMLDFLLSRDEFKLQKPDDDIKLNDLLEFDQTEFFKGIEGYIGLSDVGYLYVPKKCKAPINRCHLHIYFHGCLTGRDMVGDIHFRDSGFLEVAEQNGIVIIFPQAKKTEQNPLACFDAYGYTGKDFANKQGVQIRTVHKMLIGLLF